MPRAYCQPSRKLTSRPAGAVPEAFKIVPEIIHMASVRTRIAENIRGVQISFFSFSVYRNENLHERTWWTCFPV